VVEVGLVLGKPPRRSPVLGELVTRLRSVGARVSVQVDDGSIPVWLSDVDLVAHRGVSSPTLELLVTAERAGIAFCDPPSVVLFARDRRQVAARLRAAGVPVPPSAVASTWDEVRAMSASRGPGGMVVKARDGTVGRGTRVLVAGDGRLPILAPFPGPYHLEEFVAGATSEVKLYRIGGHVAAFRRASTGTIWCQEPAGAWEALALRAADALALTVAGVDVLRGSDGAAVVVDVNPFPSGKRLPDAAARLADHLRSLAEPAAPASALPSMVMVEEGSS
jgi:ribosomal protein S6--L-glutamate ligase